MRINKFIASATGISRRAADDALNADRVAVNGQQPTPGHSVDANDRVTLDGEVITLPTENTTIVLNKPAGYVCSRAGQGSDTIYALLPAELHHLKPVGRLDKDSSGLLLLTTDGHLAQAMSHPSFQKQKVYKIKLDKALQPLHRQMISEYGVTLQDGVSKLEVERAGDDELNWIVRMHEGRNRQIRRTFDALGYNVIKLHRTHFGNYQLGDLASGSFVRV